MAGNSERVGMVVPFEDDEPLPGLTSHGPYLRTDEGETYRLVTAHMATQASVEFLHARSQEAFHPYLNRRVTVAGYQSGRTLWGAHVVGVSDEEAA